VATGQPGVEDAGVGRRAEAGVRGIFRAAVDGPVHGVPIEAEQGQDRQSADEVSVGVRCEARLVVVVVPRAAIGVERRVCPLGETQDMVTGNQGRTSDVADVSPAVVLKNDLVASEFLLVGPGQFEQPEKQILDGRVGAEDAVKQVGMLLGAREPGSEVWGALGGVTGSQRNRMR
jgi:hypothetical protein